MLSVLALAWQGGQGIKRATVIVASAAGRCRIGWQPMPRRRLAHVLTRVIIGTNTIVWSV